MQHALRPYVTTGVAIVGASVIAVAPIIPTPSEIQIPNPAVQVDRAVELTANEIEDAVNALAFAGAQVLVSLATLPAPVVAQLLGISPAAAQALLAGGALGLSGPLIGGIGAGGAAIQDIVDQLGSGDVAALINALIGAPATLIDGVVNGGFGPNVGPLLPFLMGFPAVVGGLINPGALGLGGVTLPGAIPTLQALITQLLSVFGGADTMSALAVTPASEGQIEGAVNALLFNLVASPIVTVAGLLGSVLAPVLGEEQAALLPLAALGLFGPLISGPGAVGSALQGVVDALGSGDFAGVLNALIGAPATIIDGAVNGGFGPNLAPLVVPVLFPGLPESLWPVILSGGLINEQGVTCCNPFVPLLPTQIVLPGTFPTVQKLVGQLLGLVSSGPTAIPGLSTLQGIIGQILGLIPSAPTTLAANTGPASTLASVTETSTTNQRLVNVDLPKNDVTPDLGDEVHGKNAALAAAPVGPSTGLPDHAAATAVAVTAVVGSTDPGPDRGPAVVAATPAGAVVDTPPASPNGATDTTDGSKFEPEVITPTGNSHKGSNSNLMGSTVRSVVKGFGDAVKSALGGGSASTDGGGAG
jgi:hypothetical protein